MVTILMMPAETVTPDFGEINVFWKKDYDAITFVNEVTNKILLRDLSYFVDVVMWPNFGNSSISIREVIITSSL